jgi:hypothetical protein
MQDEQMFCQIGNCAWQEVITELHTGSEGIREKQIFGNDEMLGC